LYTGKRVWKVRLPNGSGMSREVHVPFCERPGGRFPRPTHHETFNTLKNLGYNLEHNYGHGKKYLSTNFAMLMMLAFLIDQVQEICCAVYRKCKEFAGTYRELWNHMRTLFRYLQFQIGIPFNLFWLRRSGSIALRRASVSRVF